MRRFASLALLMLTAVLVQTTVLPKMNLFGVAPDLVLVLVICFALLDGPMSGAFMGFSAGFLTDLLLDAPKGLTGLAYLVAGYVVGSVRPYVESTSVFVPILGVFSGSLGARALYELLKALLGLEMLPVRESIQVIAMTALYNTLLVPFVYPVARRFSQMGAAEKVIRW